MTLRLAWYRLWFAFFPPSDLTPGAKIPVPFALCLALLPGALVAPPAAWHTGGENSSFLFLQSWAVYTPTNFAALYLHGGTGGAETCLFNFMCLDCFRAVFAAYLGSLFGCQPLIKVLIVKTFRGMLSSFRLRSLAMCGI